MSAPSVLALYLALAGLDLAWALVLTCLNYRSAGSAPLARNVAAQLGPEEEARARGYSRARLAFGALESSVSTLIVLAVAASGLLGLLQASCQGLGLPGFWRGLLFLATVMAASSLLGLPFSLWSTFRLERKWGFNTTSLGTWLLDGLKGLGLGICLGLPLLALLYAFMDASGPAWWLWAAAAFSAFSILLSVVYPLFIAPLFNKFAALPEGELRNAIYDLAKRLDFSVGGIYVMDGSRRSRHSNAYFTGLGKGKRIVLYDTLVAQLGTEEVLAVLAHEIGHEKRRHVLKGTVVSVIASFVAFWALSLLAAWPAAYGAFGFQGPSREALLVVFALVSGPATFFLTPLFSLWSRRHEHEADAFASRAVGGQAMAQALAKINRENASNPAPHPLYSFWYYSHPSLGERLEAIARVQGKAD